MDACRPNFKGRFKNLGPVPATILSLKTHNEIDGPHVLVTLDEPIAAAVSAVGVNIVNTDRLDYITGAGTVVDDFSIDFTTAVLWFSGDAWLLQLDSDGLLVPDQTGLVEDL